MADVCPFDITPLAVPRVINTSAIASIHYTNQDYQSLKSRLLELIKVNFKDHYNDVTESSLGMMLIECYAAMADMLSFKIDQLANELFIDTVTELENAMRLAKLVGYKPMPPLPAKAMFSAKTSARYSSDIIIPSPVLVSLDNIGYDIPYELYSADANNNPVFDTPIVMPAGSTMISNIVGLEGRTKTTKFVSKGTPNQVFTFSHENVFYGSINVKIDGYLWKHVEHFNEHKPMHEYMVEYDAYYKPSIIFGNNKAGIIPVKGTAINVSYRVAGKTTSEIISGTFDTNISASLPGVSHPIVIQINNYTKSEYGYPGDSIADIRSKLPSYLRTQNRAVTGADYKYIADSFATSHNGVVGKSTVLLRNHGCAGNIIDIIVLAKTGEQRLLKANDNLKADLLDAINKKKMLTDFVCIKDGEILYVDVHIDCHVSSVNRRYEKDIRNRIIDNIETFFALGNWEFGKVLKEKDIIKSLADLKEIKQIDVSFITSKNIESGISPENIVAVKYNEIIRPDNISINFAYSAGDND